MKNIGKLLENIQKHESGATLQNYISAHYAHGYQYSRTPNTGTNTAATVKEAMAIIQNLRGSCGIWYHAGLFYIETSYHTYSLIEAVLEARKHHQISIYDWARDAYINL